VFQLALASVRCYVTVKVLNSLFVEERYYMINFDEEVAKFQPSLEVDQAEEAIFNNDLTDISDMIESILKEKKDK
jgi:hypothetical protein